MIGVAGGLIAMAMAIAGIVTVVVVDVARRWYIQRDTERRRRNWKPWKRWYR